uniref:FAD-binding protein n=1 Tax=Chryseobacterium endophyticum TaxID=1854762 RepID=A0AAU6WW59_9FLAO
MYDIIIIGSGAGGATMAYQLADSGKKYWLWSVEIMSL